VNVKLLFYVCDWNSNGCNDLLLVDSETKSVVACIQDATFGIDVTKQYFQGLYLDLLNEVVDGKNIRNKHDSETCLVARISRETLTKKIACNPLDPSGESVKRELSKHGVNIK
jgi:hypothetical protein